MRKPVFPNTVVLFAGAIARKSGSGLRGRCPHPKLEPGGRKRREALPLP